MSAETPDEIGLGESLELNDMANKYPGMQDYQDICFIIFERSLTMKQKRKCLFIGCESIHFAKGYCVKHYKRLVRSNSIKKTKNSTCIAKGCRKKPKRKGYCNTHYMRIWRGKGEDKPKKKCSVDGCKLRYYAKGFCQNHYMKDWRLKQKKEVLKW